MKLIPIIIALSALFATGSAKAGSDNEYRPLAWDPIYDDSGADIGRTACAGGKNGLLTKGYHKFGDLGGYVAAGEDTLPNSAGCGRCVRLQYKSKEIYVFAIDGTDKGFIIGKGAMEKLGAVENGIIDVLPSSADPEKCKFKT